MTPEEEQATIGHEKPPSQDELCRFTIVSVHCLKIMAISSFTLHIIFQTCVDGGDRCEGWVMVKLFTSIVCGSTWAVGAYYHFTEISRATALLSLGGAITGSIPALLLVVTFAAKENWLDWGFYVLFAAYAGIAATIVVTETYDPNDTTTAENLA
ncbi:hypothetical protein HII31_00920 [Pseudocercospora fuligena]|uniref:Uncharacterized protein n=1 Tax=Pseudocercospora fuligena TaxID=685502 RepID=A0A8H6RVC6_9PEZI|nr:hypothetical protein HII31_00920 [Pseudocercospora fuligena]